MDYISNLMDFFRSFTTASQNFHVHLAQYKRETDRELPVLAIGYFARKTERVRWTFNEQNFSFVLSGSGDYVFGGRVFDVKAPCVITQSPGQPTDYGPHDTWEELYVMYPGDAYDAFVKRRLFDPDRPSRNLDSPGNLHDLLRQLMRLLNAVGEPFVIDKIDAMCEMMILESISNRAGGEISREERIVRDLETRIRKDALEDYDFDAYARQHGMHPATFRRYWARHAPLPPDRLVMQLRMGEACRMLVETDRTVSQIAYAVKFEDPLYFSRRFRKEFACTATEYRDRYRRPFRQSAPSLSSAAE